VRFAVPFLLLVLFPAALPVLAGDTTYSRTEAVPKAGPSSYPPDGPGADDPDEVHSDAYENPTASGAEGRDFMSQCLQGDGEVHSLEELGAGILVFPFRLGFCATLDGLITSHAHLFVGNGNLDGWDEGRWRFGWGFGIGMAVMPSTAAGLPLNLNLEAAEALTSDWQLRLRSGAFAHLLSSAVDYRREVFVDGKPIGNQMDLMTGYIQSGFPLFADGIRLLGNHGLYLAGGAGLVALHETIDYVRLKDYAPSEPQREDGRWQVLPALDLGMGRYGGGGGRSLWRFEIRYQAILHFPRGLTSFPGDNAGVTHAVTWQWAWF
jgi:hypothetical protein